ncbi:heme/hemin ABC transporter substrate-binding protein [Microvirga pudoricolor]|uniref:heme/hemin ABC transporter substrate-binding protein n=1 Tax=Microvirga pudoricolor TaxID=2778729 RepID=UPI00195065A5|nr:ABC transporter substrate-binding protein [Microvirga pudoricolor]MBM6596246.1 ABC transporter substrate-binding protein [Microvirga pudoricolor]
MSLPFPSRLRVSRRALILGSLAAMAARPAPAQAPRRIVSVGGAITEILYRLGHQDEIVGVDTTSLYPAEAMRTKKSVGYVRALGAEGVLSLQPTLVLALDGAGPPDVLRILEQAGVPLTRVPDDPSREGVIRKIEIIARAVGAQDEGAALIREVEGGFSKLTEERNAVTRPVRALFVLSLQNGRPMVGGRGTTADAILSLAGATNAASALDGWKPLSDEGVIAAAPEAVVMMAHGPSGAGTDPFTLPAFASTPAAKDHRLVVMDGLYLLGFGPRTPAAAGDLMTALRQAPRR